MTRKQQLETLLRAEALLKQARAGYAPDRPYWRRAMPLLWRVRVSLPGPEGAMLAQAHGLLKQTEHGYDPRAARWREAMRLIDQVEAKLARPPIPNLGPVIPGGKPILLEAPTHNTDGLVARTGSEYPAFDFGWRAGLEVLAPEPLEVTRQSSAQGADAFYAVGESTLGYWLGHIVSAPATGRRFARGAVVARIAAIPGIDHGHLGIDARPLIGHDMTWGKPVGRDYTFGGPTIGQQLTKALAA